MVTQEPDMRLMSVDDMAETLQLNKATVQRWIREGRIPAKRLGKEYRITRQEFIDWYNNYRQEDYEVK